MKEKREYLLDDWMVHGTDGDKQKLYSVLEHLSNATHVMNGKTDNLQILTYCMTEKQTGINGYLHNKMKTQKVKIPIQNMDDVLIQEMVKDVKTLFVVEKEIVFTTQRVFRTLSQRAGSACGDFVSCKDEKVRFHRDAGYIAYMSAEPADCTIMYRQQGNVKKIFAVFAKSYQLLPQYPIIKNIIEGFEKEMGESTLVYYCVDNFNTEIFIDFPEKAKDFANVYTLPDAIIPGIHIHVSDTGESSVIINGTIRYRKNCTFIPRAEYKREHTKNATLEGILKNVETKIFSEYTTIPKQMMVLLGIDIKDPKTCIEKVVEYIGIGKLIGKKTEKSFLESLQSQINPTISYTAYDIAGLFLESSEELCNGRSIDAADKIRVALTKALWYKY